MSVQRFPYRATIGANIFKSVLTLGIAVATGWMAYHNDKGLRIVTLTLSPQYASYFFYALSVLLGGAALWIVAAMIKEKGSGPSYIELTETKLVVPKVGMVGRDREIAFNNIRKITPIALRGADFLSVEAKQGKGVLINRLFMSRADYIALLNALDDVRDKWAPPS